MPVLQMYGPKMTQEQKKKLIEQYAKITSDVLNVPIEAVNTTIFEVDPHNVGNGVEVLADRIGDR